MTLVAVFYSFGSMDMLISCYLSRVSSSLSIYMGALLGGFEIPGSVIVRIQHSPSYTCFSQSGPGGL